MNVLCYSSFLDELTKIANIGKGAPYLTDQIGKPKTRPKNPMPPEPKYKVKEGMIPTSITPPGTPMQKLTKSQTVGTPDDKNMVKFKPMSIQQPKSVKEPSGAAVAQAPNMPSMPQMPKVGEAEASLSGHRVQVVPTGELPLGDIPLSDASAYDIALGNKSDPELGGKKLAFQTSSFSGELGEPHFVRPPSSPPFRIPNIYGRDPQLKESGSKDPPKFILDRNREENEKRAGVAVTPKGRLAAARDEGKPKSTGFAGPSIADVSKPIGYGTKLPGTLKNRI